MALTVALLNDVRYANDIQTLAAQLHLPVINSTDINAPDSHTIEALLHFAEQDAVPVLSLSIVTQSRWQPFYIDFIQGALAWRREHGGGELLVRAVRGRKKDALTVLDATAGLGRDSFVLASHGFSLQMFERNPVVFVLLKDALDRARQSSDAEIIKIISRMQLQSGDVRTYLSDACLQDDRKPDVIYLDPMFPESKNSALVKKEMQVFHYLVGSDEDADNLLDCARRGAKRRVVVKRPVKAEFLAGEKPAYQLFGKAIRFDVYLPV